MKISFDHDTNQTRTVGMPLASSEFDTMRLDPFTRMASNPAKLDRCVSHVKAKGVADNPWAVCQASLGRGKHG
jgi:hypothetical protein